MNCLVQHSTTGEPQMHEDDLESRLIRTSESAGVCLLHLVQHIVVSRVHEPAEGKQGTRSTCLILEEDPANYIPMTNTSTHLHQSVQRSWQRHDGSVLRAAQSWTSLLDAYIGFPSCRISLSHRPRLQIVVGSNRVHEPPAGKLLAFIQIVSMYLPVTHPNAAP